MKFAKQKHDFVFIELRLPLISPKDISRINFLNYIVQATVITVDNYGLALLFELCKFINYQWTKKSATIFKC